MTSFKRTQRKYVQKAYRVRTWREYETGLRARGSLTVWLGLTDGKLANWNSPRPTRRKPGRQRQYSNHAIETTVTLGLVFGLASRQTEGFLRSLLTLLNLDNDVPDHSTISRRKARLGKVASYERRTVKPVHLLIDSSGLSVHVGQLRTPPKARDYRKLHLAVDEQTSDVVACELTSKRARDASRVASLVGQIERPIASAKADAAYDTGDVYKTLENHRAHRSPKVLIPPRKGAQLALDSAGTRQRNRNIRARSRVDGSQSLDPLGLATAGPLVGTGLTGRKAARTLESLCFAGSAPGPSRSLPCALLWRACGRTPSEHQPTPTPVRRARPRMSSTTRRHTGSAVPGRPPRRPSRSVWSANGLALGGHPLSASLAMYLPSTRYGGRSLTASGHCRGRGLHSPRFAGHPL